MPTYRCFCLTSDNRIIAGAHIVAANSIEAVEAAHRRWRAVRSFHQVEIWLRKDRVYPPEREAVDSYSILVGRTVGALDGLG
jgi:hypothetical protein